MFKLVRAIPFFRLLAIAQTLLLARRHLRGLDRGERRRLRELVMHGWAMSPGERNELRGLLAKLEPKAFTAAAARTWSPVPLPRWMLARLLRLT
jgi:hypothetical protein